LLAVALVWAAGCGKNAEVAPAPAAEKAPANEVVMDAGMQRSAGVAVEEARVRSLPEVVRATARLTNDENRTWRVGAITDGRIVKVLANPGDTVRKGAVLARMHSHDIHEARAAYQKARSELARARSEEAYSLRARDRARRLYELKAGSLEQLEHAETELKNAQAVAANAEVELNRTRDHLTEFLGIPAEATGGGEDSESIPVVSPAAGVVISRAVTPGTVVTPANDLFVLSDLGSLWAMAEVNEEYLARLRPGMAARITVQAYAGEAFTGRIAKLGEALDTATRTVKVRIDVPNRGGRLKPEMYAAAEIEMGASRPSVFVPQEATQEVRGQTVVFVRTAETRFEVRPVETGRSLNGEFEIVRGLKAGDAVAARGAFVLKSEFLKASLQGE
jgi:cobalt-zinc-cadmium efflux system membrane fusion protein